MHVHVYILFIHVHIHMHQHMHVPTCPIHLASTCMLAPCGCSVLGLAFPSSTTNFLASNAQGFHVNTFYIHPLKAAHCISCLAPLLPTGHRATPTGPRPHITPAATHQLTFIILLMKSWRPDRRCLMKTGSKLFPRIRFPGNLSPISGNFFLSFSLRSWNSLYLRHVEGEGEGERGRGGEGGEGEGKGEGEGRGERERREESNIIWSSCTQHKLPQQLTSSEYYEECSYHSSSLYVDVLFYSCP